jgi:glutathione S-transferase
LQGSSWILVSDVEETGIMDQRILYGTPLSGHSHRVELLLLMLELPYRFSEAPAAVRQSDAFRRLNPLGQIPVLGRGDETAAIEVVFRT